MIPFWGFFFFFGFSPPRFGAKKTTHFPPPTRKDSLFGIYFSDLNRDEALHVYDRLHAFIDFIIIISLHSSFLASQLHDPFSSLYFFFLTLLPFCHHMSSRLLESIIGLQV